MKYYKGFLLIELMVVIFLFCFLATIGVMHLFFLDTIIVRTEIDKLSIVCAYLRQLAIATNEQKVLFFDSHRNEYRFEGCSEKLSQRVCFGCLPGIKGPPGMANHSIERAITFPHQKIFFYPSGIISSGTVYIIDKKGESQYALSNAVSQVSYLRMYHHDGCWKLLG